MKNYSLILFMIVLASCASVRKHNEQTVSFLSPEELKEDVDYAYSKIQELHPQLYWYISKRELDRKFDSVKSTIDRPLTPLQFYFKLQPVIADIHEGHLALKIPRKKYTNKELRSLKNRKALFGRFEYYVEEDRLYITENKDSIEHIKPGTQILSINDVPVSDYIRKYNHLITSDGFNTTFQPYFMKDMFFNFYTAEKGLSDSVKIETLYHDQKATYTLKRENKTSSEIQKDKELTKPNPEKRINDYVAINDSYNRNFKFLSQDSSVAYIKIKSFSRSYSDKFYKEAFGKIKKAGSSYLIIDVRNNYGGSLYEINNLYSYLAPEPFILIKPSQITSKLTPLRTNYFRKSNPFQYAFKSIIYPSYVFAQTFSTYKKDGKVYYRMKAAKPTNPQKDAFHGKVFVLINGGSFSASSIITSKLKNDKRVVLVGEETGGANDGTVAGFYSYQQLPHSKIKLPIGLLLVQPNINFTHTQRGVIPDVKIKETIEDIIEKKDPQLEWVQHEIAKEKAESIPE
ncbi:S41 family peptidase [Chryseobacterium sp. CT-SW4]|uniref:S41 family peptidase n=1 Tax=Chryseobacterium sp. SW-1 TaxID=3157343 RepID=UPI003B029D83